MEQEKIKSYYQMWSRAWTLFRNLLEKHNGSDSFWEYAINQGESLCSQYEKTECSQLSNKIMIDILEELQRIEIAERGNE